MYVIILNINSKNNKYKICSTQIIYTKLFHFIETSGAEKAKTPIKYCTENDQLYL